MKKFSIVVIILVLLFVSGCSSTGTFTKNYGSGKSTERKFPLSDEKEPFVDLSAWQEGLDFDLLVNAGVKGVILRLARFNLDVDTCFDTFYNEAKARNLKVGAYYFMNATDKETALNDAEKVLKILKDNEYELDLPVFYDVENSENTENTADLRFNGRLKNASVIETFCDKLIEEGYPAGYYCNTNFSKYYISTWKLQDYPFWLAKYNADEDFDPLAEYQNVCIWQYTNQGQIEGYEEYLDFDWVYVDFSE